MHKDRGLVSIWFFIGILLLAYGVLILGASVYDVSHPAEHPVVLAELHAGLWMGALILVIGAFYTFHFYPKKGK
jgi:hypothetical protein